LSLTRTTFRYTRQFDIEPFNDSSAAYVFCNEPPSVLILDSLSWLTLELCNDTDFDTVESCFLEASKGIIEKVEAREVLEQIIEDLQGRDLVAAEETN